MTDNSKNKHIGKIIMFNGKFGFIHSDEGNLFFHKTGINPLNRELQINDPVEFEIENIPAPHKLGINPPIEEPMMVKI